MQITKIYCDLCKRKVYQSKAPPYNYPYDKLTVSTMGEGIYGGCGEYSIAHEVVCFDCHLKIVNVITETIIKIKKTSDYPEPE